MFTIDFLNIFISLWLKPMLILIVVLSIAKNSFVFSASANHWFLTSSLFAIVFSVIAWCAFPSIDLSLLPQSIVPLTKTVVSLDSFSSTFAYVIFAIYILGVTWVAFFQLFGLVDIFMITKNARPILDTKHQELLQDVQRSFSVDKDVELKETEELDSPVMWGHWSPVILLPMEHEQWDDERRKRVLAHEMAHIKRNDWMLKLISKCVCAIFWLVPLAWYVANRLEWYAELASDDEVVDRLDCRTEYAQDLMDLSSETSPSSWVLNFIRASELFIRIQHVLDGRNLRQPVHTKIKTLQILGVFVFVLPLSLLHAVPAPKTIDFNLYDQLVVVPNQLAAARKEEPESLISSLEKPEAFILEDIKTFVAIPSLPRFEEEVVVREKFTQREIEQISNVSTHIVRAEDIRHVPEKHMVSPSVDIKGVIPQRMVAPVYPKRAIDRGIEGIVLVQFDIAEDGSIKNPKIVVSQPKRIFDRAVMRALKKSRYRPMVIEGQATQIKNVTETYFFKLYESTTDKPAKIQRPEQIRIAEKT